MTCRWNMLKKCLKTFALGCVPVLLGCVGAGCSRTPTPAVYAPLAGDQTVVAGDLEAQANLGSGARFVEFAGRKALANGRDFAAEIPVPDAMWGPRGSVAFWFTFDKTLLSRKSGVGQSTLFTCPVFTMQMKDTQLMPKVKRENTDSPGSVVGSYAFSRFEGGKAYHLVAAWDASTGDIEVYLNGVIQAATAFDPWPVGDSPSGPLRIGLPGSDARMTVDSVQYFPTFLKEADVRALLEGQDVPPLEGEGRTIYKGSLDLSPWRLTKVYETEFRDPLKVIHEDDLFQGEKRARLPEGAEWVLEGKGRAYTENGRLFCDNDPPLDAGNHTVLWNTRVFPKDFLLEFDMAPRDPRNGLTIAFFATRPVKGETIFDLHLPKRAGDFREYIVGQINGYHCSYWSAAPETGSRRTVNLRKNSGFYLASMGVERIAEKGPGPHRVRILKVGNQIWCETRGKVSLHHVDQGRRGLPVWGDGYIGLRQMGHSGRCSYGYMRVSKVEPR